MKPRSAGHLYVGRLKFMSSFAASSFALAAVSPAPTLGVSPSALPLSPLLSRAALAYVCRFRYAGGVMSRMYSPSPTLPPTASASATSAPSLTSVVCSAKTGRLGAVGLLHRSHSATRRLASADSLSSAVACGGGVGSPALFQCVCLGGRGGQVVGAGVATAVDAQPIGQPRSLRSLDAAR